MVKTVAVIEVRDTGPGEFRVQVDEGGSSSEHQVTASQEDLERLASGYPSAEEFIRACFEFLLAREPKEQILPRFDITVIPRYFPEFEKQIRRKGED
jgi:formate dehydrogenase assembly factor FdhD